MAALLSAIAPEVIDKAWVHGLFDGAVQTLQIFQYQPLALHHFKICPYLRFYYTTASKMMADNTWDVHTASEDMLIELCHQTEELNGIIGGYKAAIRVIKLSNDIAVKFGRGVTAAEARTQEFAHQNVNPSIVHVPKVYRFFEWDYDPRWSSSEGYLFMEYVPGQTLAELDLDVRDDIVPRIAQIIAHLGQIGVPNGLSDAVPGPIGGGSPRGYLWGEDGAGATFTCVSDLNDWLNKRLKLQKKSINLHDSPLVLCHLDLARRNMILREDNTISLVDWGFAGLYPRFYETTTLPCLSPWDAVYQKPLIEATNTLLSLTDEENRLAQLVQTARAVSLQYSL
ncbi:hypothetical protein VE03_04179 [Pseudogymnoascus sp. 23342-1-I1]|nr:hypothetical protein VE03_04179 [Pseudogymnoascus sp. 23342-1-I1]